MKLRKKLKEGKFLKYTLIKQHLSLSIWLLAQFRLNKIIPANK